MMPARRWRLDLSPRERRWPSPGTRPANAKNAATKTKRLYIAESSEAPNSGHRAYITTPPADRQSTVSRFAPLGAPSTAREHACDFDRSQLYSDEGPPIGAVATEPWAEAANPPQPREGPVGKEQSTHETLEFQSLCNKQLRYPSVARRLRRIAAADRRAGRGATKPRDERGIVNIEAVVSAEFRKNAKVVGNEIAWRGADIIAVLKELAQSRVAVMGVESVIFPGPDSAPLVEAISDCSPELQEWRRSELWDRCVDRALSRSIFDIERTTPNPYRDSIWYILSEEPVEEQSI